MRVRPLKINGIASYEIGLHKLYILYVKNSIFNVIYWQIKYGTFLYVPYKKAENFCFFFFSCGVHISSVIISISHVVMAGRIRKVWY